MEFYYIRHAQSTNNALYTETGSSYNRSDDPELTQRGWEQAHQIAELLRSGDRMGGNTDGHQESGGFGITHLYSSLMLRSVATGTVISEAINIPLHAWVEVHECGGIFLDDETTGKYVGMPGKNRAFFHEHFPGLILPDDLGEEGWWNRSFEAEEDRIPRAKRFMAELIERHGNTEDRVAVVSHGGFYNEFLTVLYGQPERSRVWAWMYNTAVTRVDFNGSAIDLIYSNRTTHLPAGLLT